MNAISIASATPVAPEGELAWIITALALGLVLWAAGGSIIRPAVGALGLAAGDDGLDIAHRIIAGAADHLTEDGLLIVEVGNSWGAMDDAYPDLPLTWLEFENGGDGVFLVTARDLREWQARNSSSNLL